MEVTNQQSKDLLENAPEIPVDVQQFKQVEAFTTFFAEYTVKGADLVFHFFQTNEHPALHYWKKLFPQALDQTAREFFKAERPTLEASYVEGVNKANAAPDDPGLSSWWMMAHGFAKVPDPELLADRFLEQLDQALDKINTANPG